MHRPALAAWLLLAAARGAAAFASSTAWCGASRGPLPRARPGCPRGPSPASPRCWRRPAPAAGARAGFEGGGEEPEEWEALEAQDQKLRKNRRDVARGLREDVARLEADNSTAILQRMSVPREKDAQRRGTSTMFLAAELTTDDGLQLSGNLLLEARSNWVRDLLSTGNSLLLRRIADRLGFVGLWAISVSLYFALSPAEWHDFVHVPAWPHELVGGFLSILLVFRTDQAYQRFWEGRAMWADVAGHLRSMGLVTVTVLEEGDVRDVVLAHLCAFPVMLKQHLRGVRSGQEILSIVEALGVQDCQRARGLQLVVGCNNMPLTLLTSLSSQLRGANRIGNMTRDDLALFKESISSLTKILSDCEKLRCTPIPLSYSRHTSRFFTLFSLSLPFALVEDMSSFLVAPVVVFVSWILFATEEIGLIIEEPFGRGLQPPPPPPIEASDEDLRMIFDYFDVDGSGMIDKTELFLALDRLGIEVKVQEIEALVKKVDANKNQLIEFEEFAVLVESCYELASGLAAAADDRYRDPYTADGYTQTNAVQTEYSLPGRIFTSIIKSIFDVLALFFSYDNQDIATVQLEVLPLDKYVYGIQRDILQQAAFVAALTPGQGLLRQRYMNIAAGTRCQDQTRYKAPWRLQAKETYEGKRDL